MNILVSDLTNVKNKYEKCRELASNYGIVTILKKKQPDSVLLSIEEYERLSKTFKMSDDFYKSNIVDLIKCFPPKGNRTVYTLAQLKDDLKKNLFDDQS